jgi:hypothetical protein
MVPIAGPQHHGSKCCHTSWRIRDCRLALFEGLDSADDRLHDLAEQQPFVGQLRLALSGPSMGG